MIPLKLQLKNFMCYAGDATQLDFSGIHLACIAGDNGHGKSALLDAITWALWGKARDGKRRDDELITLGRSEMQVEYEFELESNRYRVLRKRSKKGRTGLSDLQLQVWSDGLYRSLTENSIAATQRKINDLLRMEYETFINSAFLLQGRADEFTVKTAGERKRILGDILGLGIYATYEERAKELVRLQDEAERAAVVRLQEIEAELAHKPAYEEEHRRAQAEAEAASQARREAEEVLRRLRDAKSALDLKAAQLAELDQRLAAAAHEIAELRHQADEHRRRILGYEATLQQATEIEKGYAAWIQARQLDEALNQKLSQSVELEREKNRLEQRIAAARHALATQQQLIAQRVAEWEARAGQIARLTQDCAATQREIERLAARQTARDAARQQIQVLSNETASLKTTNAQLKAEMDALKKKLDLLQSAEATCPVCEQPLGAAERERVLGKYQAEGKAKADAYRTNQKRSADIADETRHLEQEANAIEQDLKQLVTLQRREAMLTQALSEAQTAAQALSAERARVAAIEGQLARGEFAPEEQRRLAQLLQQAEALGYDAAAHAAARQALIEYGPFEAQKAALDSARQLIAAERQTLARVTKSLEREQKQVEADQVRRAELAGALAGLETLKRQVVEQQAHLDALQGQEAYARQVMGAARQKLESCRYLEQEKQKQMAQARQATEERGLYEELRSAFSKNGVQALLIESAIPEIETEANRLLARMTDGRMHVRFETQRETLKGETVETLEIKLADESGTRNYEMFSGGEAFRADLAIRIALSKLLARRAGAQLQTLVIDEGFGTQDTQGRERLVEAINAIKEDFKRVLVITHIDELRDMFPVRIDVVKTAEGSSISMS